MRITPKPETTNVSGASETPDHKQRTSFSETLEKKKNEAGEDARTNKHDKAARKQNKPEVNEALAAEEGMTSVHPIAVPLAAMAFPQEAQAFGTPVLAAAPISDKLISSLVQEIVVHAPPGENASVDIQFDSKVLEGLRVRIEKAGESLQVRFSTDSEPVSRLLAANAETLTQTLVQQGYVAPAVSVQRATGAQAFSGAESRYSGGNGSRGGRQDKGRGQNRR